MRGPDSLILCHMEEQTKTCPFSHRQGPERKGKKEAELQSSAPPQNLTNLISYLQVAMHEIRERGWKVPPLRGGRNKAFSSPPKPTYLAHVAIAVPVSVVIEQVFSRSLQSQPCTSYAYPSQFISLICITCLALLVFVCNRWYCWELSVWSSYHTNG